LIGFSFFRVWCAQVRRHFSTARWLELEAVASRFGWSATELTVPFVRWARSPEVGFNLGGCLLLLRVLYSAWT
jgi:hypothetical protein